ncbi:hypothetical protein H4R18_001737 [Coemansia javaensis]|uniref:GRAM domain-containing protein n=1 Tax=Coemansia javaensis TaxID=2761396 RepID=A0A9W8LJT5_9FUNG|nr:hypothetical protein H4R18_001737 [Coemansia javaensis]
MRMSCSDTLGPSARCKSEWRQSTGARSLQDPARPSSLRSNARRRRLVHRMAIQVPFGDITRISKETTLALCPNAITVATARRHYIFTNFVRRDRVFSLLAERWTAALAAETRARAAARARPRRPPLSSQAAEPADAIVLASVVMVCLLSSLALR